MLRPSSAATKNTTETRVLENPKRNNFAPILGTVNLPRLERGACGFDSHSAHQRRFRLMAQDACLPCKGREFDSPNLHHTPSLIRLEIQPRATWGEGNSKYGRAGRGTAHSPCSNQGVCGFDSRPAHHTHIRGGVAQTGAHRKTRSRQAERLRRRSKAVGGSGCTRWRLELKNLEWVCDLPEEAGFPKPTAPIMRVRVPPPPPKLTSSRVSISTSSRVSISTSSQTTMDDGCNPSDFGSIPNEVSSVLESTLARSRC
jgi:hypothetical protein